MACVDPMQTRPTRVEAVRQETADTFTMELAPLKGSKRAEGPCLAGRQAPRFLAGQFNMLYVYGAGEVPISISGDPGHPGRIVHTARRVGPVTRAMGKLKRGDAIGVRGPFGSHWPVEEAKGCDVLILAGGIGLAPLRPVLYQLLSDKKNFGRIVLLYGARTPKDALYRREWSKWRAEGLDLRATVDRADSKWKDHVGVVTLLVPQAPVDPANTVTLVCGPEVMMRFAIEAARKKGVAASNIYVSLERNMKCAVGFCGHCQFGPFFVCRDGPVFRYDTVEPFFSKREI